MRFTIEELTHGNVEISFDPSEETIADHLGSQGHEDGGHEIHVRLHAVRSGTMVVVDGEISGHVVAVCSRCLGPAPVDVSGHFHLVLLPQPEVPEDAEEDEEFQLEPDDLDTAFYSGETIDLEPHVWDQIVLAIPMSPVCSPTCPGLEYDRSEIEEFDRLKAEEKKNASPFAALKAAWDEEHKNE